MKVAAEGTERMAAPARSVNGRHQTLSARVVAVTMLRYSRARTQRKTAYAQRRTPPSQRERTTQKRPSARPYVHVTVTSGTRRQRTPKRRSITRLREYTRRR